MAHERETYSSNFPVYITGEYYKSGVKRYTVSPSYPYDRQIAGAKVNNGRAASQHVAPDQYGWRRPTPYDAFRSLETRDLVDYSFQTWTGFEGRNTVHHKIYDKGELEPAKMAQLRAEAETLCLGKFASSKVDLSVAFLERKQTASMVADWADSLVDLVRNLKKGRLGKRGLWQRKYGSKPPKWLRQWRDGQKLDALPSAWLTTRYGLAPSVQDIQGSIEALEAADNRSFERYVVTQRSRRRWVTKNELTSGTANYGAYYPIPVMVAGYVYDVYEVMVRLDTHLDDDFYVTLQELGLTNLPLTLWEVTGYSFVADWAVGVGDFLEALNARKGYVFKGGSRTEYYRTNRQSDLSIDTAKCVALGYKNPAMDPPKPHYSYHHEQHERLVYDDWPLPSIVLKRDPLNFERMWDSIFLLSNVLGNKRAAGTAAMRKQGLRI